MPELTATRLLAACASLLAVVAAGCVITLNENDVLRPRNETWTPVGVHIEPLEFESEPNIMLRGWRVRPDNAADAPLLLYFYGNEMTVNRATRLLRSFAAEWSVEVVCLDYRGFGYSDGTPTFAGLKSDALAIIDRLVPALAAPGRPVFVYGYSLGTTIATYVAHEREVDGVILEGAVTNASDFANAVRDLTVPLPLRPLVFLQPARTLTSQPQPIDLIQHITEPLLILHGVNDRITPIDFGRRMLAAAGSPDKQIIEVPGADHVLFWMHPDAPWAAVRTFINTRADDAAPPDRTPPR